ncbi:MAG: hypothetical protein ABI808_15785 [Pseudonocardiales bacterium]
MFSLELSYLRLLVQVLRDRTDEPGARDRGASAIEWAVITGIIIVVATFIGFVITNAVNNHAAAIV